MIFLLCEYSDSIPIKVLKYYLSIKILFLCRTLLSIFFSCETRYLSPVCIYFNSLYFLVDEGSKGKSTSIGKSVTLFIYAYTSSLLRHF